MKSRFLLFVLLCAFIVPAFAAPRAFSTRTLKITQRRYEAKTRYPVFSNTGSVARLANYNLKKFAVRQQESFRSEAKKMSKDYNLSMNMAHELTYVSGPFQGPRLISGHFAQYQFMGGAHPMTMTFCFNFGYSNGRAKQLTLGDFFRNDKSYQKRVTEALITKLRVKNADWIMDGSVKYFDVAQLNNFVAEKDGLHYYFDPYAVGSYAAGPFEVKLTAKELGSGFGLPQ